MGSWWGWGLLWVLVGSYASDDGEDGGIHMGIIKCYVIIAKVQNMNSLESNLQFAVVWCSSLIHS